MLRCFEILVITIIVTVNVQTPPVEEVEDAYYPAVNWSNTLDWILLKEFASAENNVLFSPISVRIVLALLYQGSNTKTQDDFRNVLQFTDKAYVSNHYRDILTSLQASEKDGYVVDIVSGIFLSDDLTHLTKFAAVAKDIFKTDIEPINFSETNSSKTINFWVGKMTKGRITHLVKPEELKDLVILVANAVYFKGIWRYDFPSNQNFFGDFQLIKDDDVLLLLRTVTVPYMTITGLFYYFEDKNLNAKILRLPYKGKRYSMFIILPNSKKSLAVLLKRVNIYSVRTLIYLMSRRIVKVTLPKFKMNYEKRMAPTLEKLGMFQIFNRLQLIPTTARWEEILENKQKVSDVIQKVGFEVNNTGAYTTAGNETDVQVYFEATHPFIYFIEEEVTGSILLVGTLENPVEEPDD